jgi:hypothetical protein
LLRRRSYRSAKYQGLTMTDFNDRERAEEAKFAHDEEMQFRIHARRNRLLGAWAAGQMGLSSVEAEAYAKSVVQADFEESSDEDVIRKLLGDLISAGVDANEADIRAALEAKEIEARRALIGEV